MGRRRASQPFKVPSHQMGKVRRGIKLNILIINAIIKDKKITLGIKSNNDLYFLKSEKFS